MNTTQTQCLVDRLAGTGVTDSGGASEVLQEKVARKRILSGVATDDEKAAYLAKYQHTPEEIQTAELQRAAEYQEQQRGLQAVSDLQTKYPELFAAK